MIGKVKIISSGVPERTEGQLSDDRVTESEHGGVRLGESDVSKFIRDDNARTRDREALAANDYLGAMMLEQEKFISRFGHYPPPASMEGPHELAPSAKQELIEQVIGYADAVMMEGAEAKDWLPWKYWSKRSGNKKIEPDDMLSPEHVAEVKSEFIDILKFALAGLVVLGADAHEVHELYIGKGKININRQERGGY